MKLNDLRDNLGARKDQKRVGRGIGSGKGKTSKRGGKGQTARSGKGVRPGFEGGQSPIYRRIPMRGFNNIFMKEFTVVNVGDLQAMVDAGRLDASQTVTMDTIRATGMTKKAATNGLKILGTGDLTVKLTIDAAAASASAIEKIKKAGGKITFPEAKKALVKGEKKAK
ncbi:MAG: 50S ribosomal protein L15 [Alphaproteobacteria bacterium]